MIMIYRFQTAVRKRDGAYFVILHQTVDNWMSEYRPRMQLIKVNCFRLGGFKHFLREYLIYLAGCDSKFQVSPLKLSRLLTVLLYVQEYYPVTFGTLWLTNFKVRRTQVNTNWSHRSLRLSASTSQKRLSSTVLMVTSYGVKHDRSKLTSYYNVIVILQNL